MITAVSAALLVVIVVLSIIIIVQCVFLCKMKNKTIAYGVASGTSGAPVSSNEAYSVDKLVAQGEYEHVSPNEAYAMTK